MLAGTTHLPVGGHMLTLIGRLGSAIFAFARYRVSTLGVRKFLGETAGLYVIDEVVDVAAEHSDWVEKNSDILKLSLGAGMIVKNSAVAKFKQFSVKGMPRSLFSKISLINPLQKIDPWMKSISVSAFQNGMEITKNGKLLLRVVSEGGKIAFNHKGSPAVAAVLAASLGGAIPSTRQEWLESAEHLAVQIADVELSLAEADLRSTLYEYAATNLLFMGQTILAQFLRKYPAFPEERAVSMLLNVLTHEDIEAGSFSLDAFVDSEGDFIIRIDGSYFKPSDEGESTVWLPAEPADGPRTPIDEEQEMVFLTFQKFLGGISETQGLSLTRMANTENFVSPPFIVGSYAMSMVLNLDNPDRKSVV